MKSGSYRIGETGRWGLAIVVAFLVFHGETVSKMYQPNTWLFRDGAFYFLTTFGLAEHGRIEQRDLQPQSWYAKDLGWNRNLADDWSDVSLAKNGGWYPKHPIVLPALAVPFYWALGIVGTLVLNVGMNLLFVLLAFLLARRVARTPVAALAAIVLTATPFVRDMSYSFSNDLLSADLVLGSMELVLAGWADWAGVLAGLSLWSRVTNVALLPALLLVGVSAGGWNAIRRAALASLLPIGLFAAFNTWLFGAPWVTTYQSVLVRANGVAQTASHSGHFGVGFRDGLRRILTGDDSVFRAEPILAPGLVGLIAIAGRRWLLWAGFVLAFVLPVIAYAKYDFYRPHFFYSAFGIEAVGLAAGLDVLIPKREAGATEDWHIPRWLVWGPAIVLLVGAAVWRVVAHDDKSLLSTHVHDAQVWLDDIPCDYWNIQNERWECSHQDHGGHEMTGRLLKPEMVHKVPRTGIWMQPSGTRRTKRMVFQNLAAQEVDFSIALGDGSKPGSVMVSILARGQPPMEVRLAERGQIEHRRVTIADGDGPALELRSQSDTPDSKPVIIEGHLR